MLYRHDCGASIDIGININAYTAIIVGVWGHWQEADAQCRTPSPSEAGLPTVRHLVVVFQESNCL